MQDKSTMYKEPIQSVFEGEAELGKLLEEPPVCHPIFVSDRFASLRLLISASRE